MAEAIKKETGIEPELIQGGGGIFDVSVDGDRIFSKHETETDRFPTHEEIIETLKSKT